MTTPPRPPFLPVPCGGDDTVPQLQSDPHINWIPVCSCPCSFPPELFQVAALQLVHHPEYNSTLILRSETLAESHLGTDFLPEILKIQGLTPVRNVHRKLLPRRPGRDAPIEQYCTFYDNVPPNADLEVHPSLATCVVLTPLTHPGEKMPYYHPAVSHLAFRYVAVDFTDESNLNSSSSISARLQIEVVPLPDAPDPGDPNSRIYRTCLALLETVHRYGWGALTNYKKRVIHDSLISREVYQDLYLVMRERHKHLVNQWKEVTDPLKHVFEDIGIATFLMLLWRDSFQTESSVPLNSQISDPISEPPPWHGWPRPPGGFLDLGCGNGLLTHILSSEGYAGEGIDVRARTSWAHYPPSSQSCLHVHALDPTSLPPSPLSSSPSSSPCFLPRVFQPEHDLFKPGAFIIANHADELTPWAPVLSTLYSASGYLSIPCCAWSFDAKFERSNSHSSFHPAFPGPSGNASTEFIESLNLGGDGGNTSSYSTYRIWLAKLSLYCGWDVECETLRIPSTRNWAIIGRKRRANNDEYTTGAAENAREIVRKVRERGVFKTRRPEGKAADH